MMLKVQGVTGIVNEKTIIENIHLQVSCGEFVGLIGPNGSGKSTLLKHMYRVQKPDAGFITLKEQEIFKQSAKKIAKQMAVVSQESPILFDFSVYEIVLMGRSPHKRLFEQDTKRDQELVYDALEKVGMFEHKDRSYMTLSGGEKQRVLIARALAQQVDLLVLDEPTNHLDIQHQLQILDLVKSLNFTVVAALHDLNLAAAYCDYLYVIDNGHIVASGPPEEVLRSDLLRRIFRVETDIVIHPITGKVHITFLSDYMINTHQRSRSFLQTRSR
ncbi:ABC transporter ATP-binding protein [Anaerobacillus sp. MEB173]|uniref:ABC transporter ATP-binding protein n=1 Tax=Anaerobacillus sp. MEB173 TaxID=3383345 RepID=UPI003F903529